MTLDRWDLRGVGAPLIRSTRHLRPARLVGAQHTAGLRAAEQQQSFLLPPSLQLKGLLCDADETADFFQDAKAQLGSLSG